MNRILDIVEEIRSSSGLPYRSLCAAVRLPYSNVMRWRGRRRACKPLVVQPGPGKVEPLPLQELKEEVVRLKHAQDRTESTGVLYRMHHAQISRRDLQSLVRMAREDEKRRRRTELRRIEWLIPNLAWAMDHTEFLNADASGRNVYYHHMQDLCSRYKFSPLSGEYPYGEGIATYLDAQFDAFGAPLFLKRDNGGNVNHSTVDEVLARHLVIPLNSPAYYAPYNGAIEHAQGELKAALRLRLGSRQNCPREHAGAYAAAAEHDLNHQHRDCLKGRNACQVYFANKRSFSKIERRDAYVWISDLQSRILTSMQNLHQPMINAALRIAAEAWLRMKGFITVTIDGKVLPTFHDFWTH